MRKLISLALALGLLGWAAAALGTSTAVVVASPLYGITETATASPVPSATPTRAPSATPTSAASPTLASSPTAVPSSTTRPRPAATATTGPIVVDPIISKVSDLQQARAGDAVQFTILVTNPNSIDIANVVVTDALPEAVDFLSATTSQGTFSFDAGSRTLTFTLGTMTPGEVITIVIKARVNDKAKPPDPLRNVATVCFAGNRCASSNTASVGTIPPALPGAGVGPGPQEVLVMALAGLAVVLCLALGGWWIWRQSAARG